MTKKIVVLDGYTLNPGDLSWDAFQKVAPIEVHDRTEPAKILERARGAEFILTNKTPLSAEATTKTSAAVTAASTVLTKFEWVYTKRTGVWYPKVAPGDAVRKGEQIGTVGDLFGDTLEEIVSPVNGVVLFLTINPSVLGKGLLMGIGAA